MKAQELMSTSPFSIPAGATANDAMMIMSKCNLRHLPVVDARGCVVGMISDRNLLELPRPQFAGAPLAGPLKTPLDSGLNAFMSRHVFSVTADTELSSVIDMMLEHSVDAIPVVDKANHLVGLVSSRDVLMHSRNLM